MLVTKAKLPKSINPFYCDYCQRNIFSGLIQKYKNSLCDQKSLTGLISNGDILKF